MWSAHGRAGRAWSARWWLLSVDAWVGRRRGPSRRRRGRARSSPQGGLVARNRSASYVGLHGADRRCGAERTFEACLRSSEIPAAERVPDRRARREPAWSRRSRVRRPPGRARSNASANRPPEVVRRPGGDLQGPGPGAQGPCRGEVCCRVVMAVVHGGDPCPLDTVPRRVAQSDGPVEEAQALVPPKRGRRRCGRRHEHGRRGGHVAAEPGVGGHGQRVGARASRRGRRRLAVG